MISPPADFFAQRGAEVSDCSGGLTCRVFEGKGWGHKVGLCQWGSKTMGDKGFTYKQILEFYYPKTKVGKIKYANK